ncbi:MAG: NUDIX hydrolase [Anaerotruncus sp.]|nr:NUDIX hydrolase [Anaerotruncus sp.]
MEHFERKLESQQIYQGKILSLRCDKVELEDGRTAFREVIDHHGGVAILAVDDQDHILFVSQFRYAVGEQLLELPAGKLELGENPRACGIRELEEECGCTADEFFLLGRMYPTCAYDTETIHIFFARGLHPAKQHLDDGEFLTVKRIPAQEAFRMVLEGELPDGKTQLGILKYKALRDAGRL